MRPGRVGSNPTSSAVPSKGAYLGGSIDPFEAWRGS